MERFEGLEGPMIGPEFPLATEIPFASFNRKYAGGSCYVVGRGPTEFDYEKLTEVGEPIFFVNDAVCLERYVRGESYFFAHDGKMRVWLDRKIKSTAVLPLEGDFLREISGVTLGHTGKVVFYRSVGRKEQLLLMSRDQIARAGQLYMHSGTIHSVIHFAWFCGFKRVNFVGCDCIGGGDEAMGRLEGADGYDARLENLSGSVSCRDYLRIGKAQELLVALLGLEARYLGRPGGNHLG